MALTTIAAAVAILNQTDRPTPFPALIPLPAQVTQLSGTFTLDDTVHISASGDAVQPASMLQNWIKEATGLKLLNTGEPFGKRIEFEILKGSQLNLEAYRLVVRPDFIRISSPGAHGLFNGIQTLRQLFPTAIYSKDGKAKNLSCPSVQIDDEPRFFWRGAMLDVCRHFWTKNEVMEFIDAMAIHKLSTLHFHLTDDQGWRAEIKKYPKLTTVGGFRTETVLGHNSGKFDGKPYGGFYTQKELREIVKYAADRHINVVPEIEMPGHMVAAITAYPELCDGKQHEVLREWGVSFNVLNLKPETVQFAKDVLTEIMDIFPSKFIHVGGDECPRDQWKNDPAERERMAARGVLDVAKYQPWFTNEINKFLTANGRRLIGWDEILEGDELAKDACVMSWRGEDGGIEAANKGHDVVMSPGSHCYLDHYQADPKTEPDAIGGFTTLEKVYSYEPVPAQVKPDLAFHILGTQGNLWAEYFPTFAHMEYMAFPRLCALAEVGWSQKDKRDWNSFSMRLPSHLDRLTTMGVNFRHLDAGTAGR